MPLLLCRHIDRRTEWRVSVAEGDFTIGCSEAADVALADRTIAAREVLITHKGDRYLLQDLAEKGRVLLGGTVTRTGLLKDGDRLRVGRVSLIFFEDRRAGTRQVEPDRDGQTERTEIRFPDFFEELDRDSRAAEAAVDPPSLPRGVIVGALAASFAVGLVLGIITTRPTKEAPVTSIAPATPNRQGHPSDARPLDEALKQLKETLGRKESQGEPAFAGEPGALKVVLGKPADTTASRLALFRLFLDLAGRPPTRGEASELLPLNHDARWRKILGIAARDGSATTLAAPADALWMSWLGREPSSLELNDVTTRATPERPAAFWISATEEYRLEARRRPRSAAARARSFIVDLLDRPPGSPAEVEAVRAALDAPGGALEAARTLVYSIETRGEPAGGSDSWWEDELFRFLLRTPRERERVEIPRILGALEPGARRIWFLLALASLDEYGSY